MIRSLTLAACAAALVLLTAGIAQAGEQQDKPKRVPSMMTGSGKPAQKAEQPVEDAQKSDQAATQDQAQGGDRKRCRDAQGNKKPNC